MARPLYPRGRRFSMPLNMHLISLSIKKICKHNFEEVVFGTSDVTLCDISAASEVKVGDFCDNFFSHSTNSSTSSWETSWNSYTTCCRSSDDKNKNKYFLCSNKKADTIENTKIID